MVGRPKDRSLAAAITDYETRAAHYWPLEVHEIREASARSMPLDEVRAREGERLVERVAGVPQVIACDEGGERLTSAQFSLLLSSAHDAAVDIAFVIGGAYGLHETVRQRARRSIQLAPFTLPHELARLVLAEQLYRAGTIARGEPYHKA